MDKYGRKVGFKRQLTNTQDSYGLNTKSAEIVLSPHTNNKENIPMSVAKKSKIGGKGNLVSSSNEHPLTTPNDDADVKVCC